MQNKKQKTSQRSTVSINYATLFVVLAVLTLLLVAGKAVSTEAGLIGFSLFICSAGIMRGIYLITEATVAVAEATLTRGVGEMIISTIKSKKEEETKQ